MLLINLLRSIVLKALQVFLTAMYAVVAAFLKAQVISVAAVGTLVLLINLLLAIVTRQYLVNYHIPGIIRGYVGGNTDAST